jgi:hypothetical protein
MKKLTTSDLVALPEKNQQEAERLAINFERRIIELASAKHDLRLAAARQHISTLTDTAHGN